MSSEYVEWLPLILIFLLSLPILLLISPRRKIGIRSSQLPPGPINLPIIGSLHRIGKVPHRSLYKLSKKYGTLMHLQLGQVPILVVSSPSMAREVLKTHDLDFCSRPALISYKRFSYNLLDASFAPYGDHWRQMRKIYIVELLSTKRVQSFASVREEEIALVIHTIFQAASSSNLVNLSQLMLALPFNIVCRVAFGQSYECGSENEKIRFHEVLQDATALMGGFFVADFLPWMHWVDVLNGLHRRLEKNFSTLDAFFEQLIEDHLNPNRKKPDQEDFVEVMLRLQQDHHLSRNHIKAVLMDILLAGTDTSSALVIWVMAELVKNPSAMKIAQDEVRTVVGRKGKVKESDLHKLEYLHLVIKETLRLHPPVPLLIPRETREQSQIHKYEVCPKTWIYVNAFAIGRDPNSWKNPNLFLPERFMDSTIDHKGQNFEFIPFGAGRRSCPAIYFGTIVVELELANLLYYFNWELPIGMSKDDIDMHEVFGIVVHKKSPLLLVPIKA